MVNVFLEPVAEMCKKSWSIAEMPKESQRCTAFFDDVARSVDKGNVDVADWFQKGIHSVLSDKLGQYVIEGPIPEIPS